MDLIRLTYAGRKPYRDKLSGNTWQPGDTKLVNAKAGEKLLRFVEFAATDAEAIASTPESQNSAELEAAMVLEQEAQRKEDEESDLRESMLLTVESMDKPALEEYARKYEVELDKRLGVAKLRAEVSNLIEQFGAR